METIDFGKTLKDLYTANKKIKEVKVTGGTYLSVTGQGEPGGQAFTQAIGALYGAAYTMKFTLKGEGKLDFKVNKLECLWNVNEPKKTPMSQWRWQLLLRIPDKVTATQLKQAIKSIKEKKGEDISIVERIKFKEGRCMQTLHVGPYDKVEETYTKIFSQLEDEGLKTNVMCHEIYLSDPRRSAPEKLKTIVRVPVK